MATSPSRNSPCCKRHEVANAAIVRCDRGTVDGLAYWPGPEELWSTVGTSRAEQLPRYRTVIHLRTPTQEGGYNRTDLIAKAARVIELIRAELPQCCLTHDLKTRVPAIHPGVPSLGHAQ